MLRLLRFLCLGVLIAGSLSLVSVPADAQGPLVIVPRKPTDPNQLISFSFQEADIDSVLRFLAEASGKMVFKDSTVQTSVTIRNQSRIPVKEAISIIQFVLDLKGYSLVETPQALIVTTAADSIKKRSSKVTTGRELSSVPEGREIITHVIPLKGADAVRLREELNPIFGGPGGASIIANSDTNSIVVVDTADNIRRMLTLINLLDKDLTDEISVEVIRLKYADATEMARYLSDLFRPDETQRGGGGGQPQFQPGMPPGAPMATGGRSALAQLRGRVRIAADERSNSLIVYAAPANIKSIKDLIAEIDVNLAPRTEYRIIALKYADATGLSDQLNQLVDPNAQRNRQGGGFFGFFGGGGGGGSQDRGLLEYRVVPDVRTNSLVVTAPVDGITQLEDLVKRLDVPSEVRNVVRIFQLKNAIASEVSTVLRNLFLGTQQQGGVGFGLFGAGQRTQIPPNSPLDLLRQVTIVPNDQTNQLLVSGPSQTFEVIEKLLSTEEGLDRKLPQVFIEVIIADVTLDDETKYGIEWNAISGSSALGAGFGLNSGTGSGNGLKYSLLSKNFQATLNALKTNNRLKIINTPHVMVTDNSPAVITIGEQIPYSGETTITNGIAQSSVEFLDVSITLNVTPHISPGGNILMDIDQVVNSLVEFIEVSPNQLAPRTTNRRAGTTLIVKDDQTIVLGGIISDQDRRDVQKIPILGDIPLLGQLFRSTTRTKSRTELVVFITPHIVAEDGSGKSGTVDDIREYERQRLQVDPLKILDAPFRRPLDIRPEDLKVRRTRPDFLSPPSMGSGAAPKP
jgi:general secretion pathway protein D